MPGQSNTLRCGTEKKNRAALRKQVHIIYPTAPTPAVFAGVQSGMVRQGLKHIISAPFEEERIRKTDPKAMYRYYDRNKAVSILHDMTLGKATGTCGVESEERFKAMSGTRQQIRIQVTLPTNVPGLDQDHPKKAINHFAIIYHDDEYTDDIREWRYETYSNGKHMDILMCDKFAYQPFTRIRYHDFEISAALLVDMRNMTNVVQYYALVRYGFIGPLPTQVTKERFIKNMFYEPGIEWIFKGKEAYIAAVPFINEVKAEKEKYDWKKHKYGKAI